MADYDSMERPVEDEGEPLMLTFGVTLQQIIDVVSRLLAKLWIFFPPAPCLALSRHEVWPLTMRYERL